MAAPITESNPRGIVRVGRLARSCVELGSRRDQPERKPAPLSYFPARKHIFSTNYTPSARQNGSLITPKYRLKNPGGRIRLRILPRPKIRRRGLRVSIAG
jgi:hypothetical protein